VVSLRPWLFRIGTNLRAARRSQRHGCWPHRLLQFARLRRRNLHSGCRRPLLHRLLVPLLQITHLLLLLVTPMNRFPHRPAHRTPRILTTMVMTQHIPRTHTMRNLALLILAFRDMLPQPLHPRTVWCHGTPPILVRTLGGVPQEQQALLLVSQDLLAVIPRP